MVVAFALLVYGVIAFVVGYLLYLVVRTAVEHGIRRALPEESLRPRSPAEKYRPSGPGPSGEQL